MDKSSQLLMNSSHYGIMPIAVEIGTLNIGTESRR